MLFRCIDEVYGAPHNRVGVLAERINKFGREYCDSGMITYAIETSLADVNSKDTFKLFVPSTGAPPNFKAYFFYEDATKCWMEEFDILGGSVGGLATNETIVVYHGKNVVEDRSDGGEPFEVDVFEIRPRHDVIMEQLRFTDVGGGSSNTFEVKK